MGKKCLKQYHTYHEGYIKSNMLTLSQFLFFSDLGLKYHLPRLQSPVCGGGGQLISYFVIYVPLPPNNSKFC